MKKAMCKILPIFFVLVILTALALPCFADSIDSTSHEVVVNSGVLVTSFGTTSIGNVRPVAQFNLGFSIGENNTFTLTAYRADGTASADGNFPYPVIGNFTTSTDLTTVVPNYYTFRELGLSLPLYFPYGFFAPSTISGNVYNEYSAMSDGTEVFTGGYADTSKIGFRAWVDEVYGSAKECTQVTQYTLVYTPPVWSSDNASVNLGPSASLNTEQAIYNALRVGGYTTLAMTCVSPLTTEYSDRPQSTCVKYIEWLGYQGDQSFSQNVFLEKNSGDTGSTDASYQLGYDAGYAKGQSGLDEKLNEAYTDGYNAGAMNSGFIPSALLAIGEIPFNLIHSFLNFEIFGFNISAIVGIIITGCAFIWVLKKFV